MEKSHCGIIIIILKELYTFAQKPKNKKEHTIKVTEQGLMVRFCCLLHTLGFSKLATTDMNYFYKEVRLVFFFFFKWYSEMSKFAKYSHNLCWDIPIPMFSIIFVHLCLFITLNLSAVFALPKCIRKNTDNTVERSRKQLLLTGQQ